MLLKKIKYVAKKIMLPKTKYHKHKTIYTYTPAKKPMRVMTRMKACQRSESACLMVPISRLRRGCIDVHCTFAERMR